MIRVDFLPQEDSFPFVQELPDYFGESAREAAESIQEEIRRAVASAKPAMPRPHWWPGTRRSHENIPAP